MEISRTRRMHLLEWFQSIVRKEQLYACQFFQWKKQHQRQTLSAHFGIKAHTHTKECTWIAIKERFTFFGSSLICLLWIGRRARGLIFFPIYTLWHVDDIQSFHLHHVLNLCDLSMNVTSGNGCFIDRKWLLCLSHETNWRRQMVNIAPTVLLESIEFWLPIYFTINLCTSATKQTHALIAMWCVKWADLPFEHFNSFPITERMYEVGPLAFHHTLTLEWPAQRPTNNWDSIGCEREVDMLVE